MIVIYAIIGLELFKGKLHATCYKEGTQTRQSFPDLYGNNSPEILTDPGDISVGESGKKACYYSFVEPLKRCSEFHQNICKGANRNEKFTLKTFFLIGHLYLSVILFGKNIYFQSLRHSYHFICPFELQICR